MPYAASYLTRTLANAPSVSVSGSSGTAIGEHWILTANHAYVEGLPVTYNGVEYTVLRTEQIPAIDLGDSTFYDDLLLIKVAERLPAWSRIKTTRPSNGATLLHGGFGLSNTSGAVPFDFPDDAGFAGLKYVSGICTNVESASGNPDAIADELNIYWLFVSPGDGGSIYSGLLSKNDSGSSVWEVCGGENVLVAVGSLTTFGYAIGEFTGTADYTDPVPTPPGGGASVQYSGGTRPGNTGTTFAPPGFASINAWLRSIMYEDYFPEFQSAFFDTAFFANDFYRTEEPSEVATVMASVMAPIILLAPAADRLRRK